MVNTAYYCVIETNQKNVMLLGEAKEVGKAHQRKSPNGRDL